MPRLTWENKFTVGNMIQIVLLLATLISIYYGVLNRLDAQAKDIDVLRTQVQGLNTDNIPTRISVLENSIAVGGINSDRMQASMSTRLDKLEANTSARLDKVTDGLNSLSNAVAGLTAVLKRRGYEP